MFRTLVTCLLTGALLVGCSQQSSNSATEPPATTTPGPAVSVKTRTALIATREGKTDFELVPREPDIDIRCGTTIYTTKVEADRVKVFAADKLVAKVKRKEDGFEMEDGSGGRLLRVKVKAGPSLKLEDGQGSVLSMVDAAGPALTVKGPDGSAQGKVEASPEGLSFKGVDQKERAALKGSAPVAVGVALVLEKMTPEQRGALALYLLEVGP